MWIDSFGERLKNLRQDRKLSLVELDSKIGVGKSIISLWEKYECEPTLSKLILLSEFFGVSIDYFAGKEN